jgi:hypothetical protein
MANAILWSAGWSTTGGGTVLSDTQLAPSGTGLTNGTRSDAGAEINNTSGLYQYACLEVYLGSFTPTAGGYLQLHMITAPDGTNYAEGSTSVDPGSDRLVATLPLRAATGTVRKHTGIIPIPPAKLKFLLTNNSGAGLANSGNSVTMYVTADEVQ